MMNDQNVLISGKTPLEIATLFHDTYERLAPSFGYETRPDTKEFDPTTNNGKLMMASCSEVVSKLLEDNKITDFRGFNQLERVGRYESQEKKSILSTMLGKAKGEDGNHALVMGCFKVDEYLESCTFTTNPIGHPTTFRHRI